MVAGCLIVMLAASVVRVRHSPRLREPYGGQCGAVSKTKKLLRAQLKIFKRKFDDIEDFVEDSLPEPKERFRGRAGARTASPRRETFVSMASCASQLDDVQIPFNNSYNEQVSRVNELLKNMTKGEREAKKLMSKKSTKNPEKLISKSNKI